MARFTFILASTWLFWHSACVCAELPGRLFFYPEERAMMDQMRSKNGAISTSAEQITLNGIVRRSNGKTTAWINQQPQHENEAPQGVAVRGQASRPSAVLMLPSGKQVSLKAGQTFDTTRGRVREGYEEPVFSPPPQEAKK